MAFRFPIEAGQVLQFTRAMGMADPAEHETIDVPPTFFQASAHFDPDSRLRPRPDRPWVGSGRSPTGVTRENANGRLVHGEQHYEYHQDVRPGQVLSVETRTGQTWSKVGKSGPMTFTEIISEYRDEQNELVVTSTSIRVELGGGT